MCDGSCEMLEKDYFDDYVKKSNMVWKWLVSKSASCEQVVSNICRLRNYSSEEMYDELLKIGFVFIPDTVGVSVLNDSRFSDLRLFTEKGNFLLTNRYIFPVRDMLGNILAFIGWYPDDKRYITTPSKLFRKDCLFFGLEQLKSTGIGSFYVLVEGIFDSIAVRSLGYNAIAQMGSIASPQKEVLYGMFKRLLAIPDADKTGREVVVTDRWKIPVGSSYLIWYDNREKAIKSDKQGKRIKDIDDLIKCYGKDYSRYLIDDAKEDSSRVISFKL